MLVESKLENVRHLDGKITARCPACAEAGGDRHGIHLVIFTGGAWGCVANPGDKPHLRRIGELAGDDQRQPRPWSLVVDGRRQVFGVTPAKPLHSLSLASVLRQQETLSDASDDQKPILPGSNHRVDTGIVSCTRNFELKKERPKRPYLNATTSSPADYSPPVRAFERPDRPGPTTDVVDLAVAMFEAKSVRTFAPGGRIPPRFADVLRGRRTGQRNLFDAPRFGVR